MTSSTLKEIDFPSLLFKLLSNTRDIKLVENSRILLKSFKEASGLDEKSNEYTKMMANIALAVRECRETESDTTSRANIVYQSSQFIQRISKSQSKSAKFKDMEPDVILKHLEVIVYKFSRGADVERIAYFELLELEQVLATLHSFIFAPEKIPVVYLQKCSEFSGIVQSTFGTLNKLRALLTFSLIMDTRLSMMETLPQPSQSFSSFQSYLYLILLDIRKDTRKTYGKWLLEKMHEDMPCVRSKAEDIVREMIDQISVQNLVESIVSSSTLDHDKIIPSSSIKRDMSHMEKPRSDLYLHNIESIKCNHRGKDEEIDSVEFEEADLADKQMSPPCSSLLEKWIHDHTVYYKTSRIPNLRLVFLNSIIIMKQEDSKKIPKKENIITPTIIIAEAEVLKDPTKPETKEEERPSQASDREAVRESSHSKKEKSIGNLANQPNSQMFRISNLTPNKAVTSPIIEKRGGLRGSLDKRPRPFIRLNDNSELADTIIEAHKRKGATPAGRINRKEDLTPLGLGRMKGLTPGSKTRIPGLVRERVPELTKRFSISSSVASNPLDVSASQIDTVININNTIDRTIQQSSSSLRRQSVRRTTVLLPEVGKRVWVRVGVNDEVSRGFFQTKTHESSYSRKDVDFTLSMSVFGSSKISKVWTEEAQRYLQVLGDYIRDKLEQWKVSQWRKVIHHINYRVSAAPVVAIFNDMHTIRGLVQVDSN